MHANWVVLLVPQKHIAHQYSIYCSLNNSGQKIELLAEAGEATWVAGPLAKGSNLCHGTAGNACAFLALHARTGDTRWRDRARAFAMHAIAQFEAEFAAAAPEPPRTPAWQRAALLEGVSAKETIEDLRGGSAWLS